MRIPRFLLALVPWLVLAGLGVVGYFTRSTWMGWLPTPKPTEEAKKKEEDKGPRVQRIKLTPQARDNLQLAVDAVVPDTYRKTLAMPGTVIDRHGISDRGVTTPVAGVILKIWVHPGDTVRGGQPLFTLQLVSEYVQNAQSELRRISRDIQFNQEKIDRLKTVTATGAVAEYQMIDLEIQDRRLKSSLLTYEQDLRLRGLTEDQIKKASTKADYATEITVFAPARAAGAEKLVDVKPPEGGASSANVLPLDYEMKDLKVQLGDQVQAGQSLCLLSNHSTLTVEGHAFEHERQAIQQAATKGWAVRVEVQGEGASSWQSLNEKLPIFRVANVIDPASRTFDFYLRLPTNLALPVEQGDRTFLLWRFRPGQRVRLYVQVDEIEDVFILPTAAVVREGAESYVFRQNGDFFERRPVNVLHEQQGQVAVANDGSIGAGQFIAHNGAAALNRALKAAMSEGAGGGHHGHSH